MKLLLTHFKLKVQFPPLPELHDLSLLRMYRSPKDPPSSLFAGALSQAGQLFITHVLQEMLISSGSVVGAASPVSVLDALRRRHR